MQQVFGFLQGQILNMFSSGRYYKHGKAKKQLSINSLISPVQQFPVQKAECWHSPYYFVKINPSLIIYIIRHLPFTLTVHSVFFANSLKSWLSGHLGDQFKSETNREALSFFLLKKSVVIQQFWTPNSSKVFVLV